MFAPVIATAGKVLKHYELSFFSSSKLIALVWLCNPGLSINAIKFIVFLHIDSRFDTLEKFLFLAEIWVLLCN